MSEQQYRAHLKRTKPGGGSQPVDREHTTPDDGPTRPDGRQIPAAPASPRSKHGNIRTERHGITFDSKHEADVYDALLLRQKSGEIENLQRQVSFPLEVNGKRIQRWRCDFWYWSHKGSKLVVADAKSEHTAGLPAWKRTKALFESLYGITVTVL